MADAERWGAPEDLTDIDEAGGAQGVDPGAGGRSGTTGRDLRGASTGRSQDRGATRGSGMGTPNLNDAGAAPGGPSGTTGALTANDDLVGGDPEQRATEGRRQMPQPSRRAGAREGD